MKTSYIFLMQHHIIMNFLPPFQQTSCVMAAFSVEEHDKNVDKLTGTISDGVVSAPIDLLGQHAQFMRNEWVKKPANQDRLPFIFVGIFRYGEQPDRTGYPSALDLKFNIRKR